MTRDVVWVVLTVILLFLNNTVVGDEVYIIYMGATAKSSPNNVNIEKQHLPNPDDHPRNVFSADPDGHLALIASVLGSKQLAEEVLVYTYKHAFSGFAARLTASQAKQISELPGALLVMRNHYLNLKTTRSWDFLGLASPFSDSYEHVGKNINSASSDDLLSRTNMGDGIIIGILDTGIWPESKSFNDDGLGPIPTNWKGYCESGEKFNPKINCNKKLIGARSIKKPNDTLGFQDFSSPRDGDGHGTHVSAIAAGSFIHNASYHGLAAGTARGGAPRARIAMYKVCWSECTTADILKGFDEAIADGVHVISVSLGSQVPLSTNVLDYPDKCAFELATFHAVANGIPVILAGGNDGPYAATIDHLSPWAITVASSTVDRSYPVIIRLGNNETSIGQSMNIQKEISSVSLQLVMPSCEEIKKFSNISMLSSTGKVVLCFTINGSIDDLAMAIAKVTKSKGVAIIIAHQNPTNHYMMNAFLSTKYPLIPCILVDYEIGSRIKKYFTSLSSPLISIGAVETFVGKPISPKIAFSSSRGPSSVTPSVLKPDVAAPGVNIVAQTNPLRTEADDEGFGMFTGTSMAAPHVAGVVALLKAAHPDWSPAAIRSAIVTTASVTDASGGPIFAQGLPTKVADPFDYGGGIVNPNGAVDPGLIYDMTPPDYSDYLCVMANNDDSRVALIMGKAIMSCNTHRSLLDLNMPSFTIPSLGTTAITTTRIVTNAGGISSTYRVVVDSPHGVTIVVTPDMLVFTPVIRKLTFRVTFSSDDHGTNEWYCFGSLTWTDGVHAIRSPISVRKQVLEYYTDDN